ncbi:MAG TPA: L-histidine N(alpha)-methyltransferase [Longimicrobiales bacterium]|nr:L-histidine N(alpha)-methyltransferase [Longimicrobiales bacterium]
MGSLTIDSGRAAMLADVAEGLSRPRKELSPKYFYDQRGSELFEAITRLPEYYPTRSERALLTTFAPAWIAELSPVSLVELGAGAADKTRILLDAIQAASPGATYVPVDISAEFLESAAEGLREDYPALEIQPVVADMSALIRLPGELPRPAVFALLGSTIGNFRPGAAVALLGRARAQMRDGDRFLLGADLVKDVGVLEAAYNDAAGVTAAFNLNVLHVLNRELGADFDVNAFRHRAFYDPEKRRIEMHLVAGRAMTATVPGAGAFAFAAGETVRTEISCKYDRDAVAAMFADAGLVLERWLTGPDDAHRFGLAVGRLP